MQLKIIHTGVDIAKVSLFNNGDGEWSNQTDSYLVHFV